MTVKQEKWNKLAVIAGVWAAVPVLGFMALTAMALFSALTDIDAPGTIAWLIAWTVDCFPQVLLINGAIGILLAVVALVTTYVWKVRQKGIWIAILALIVSVAIAGFFLDQVIDNARMGGPYEVLKEFPSPDGQTVALITCDAPGWVDDLASLRIKERGRWRITKLADVGEASEPSHAANASVEWATDGQSFTFVWPGHLQGSFARDPNGTWCRQGKPQ